MSSWSSSARGESLLKCRDILVCPVCREALADRGSAICCANGHSFDIARDGHVNLNLGRVGGDTREMLAARRRFLDRGHYAPIADAVRGLIVEHLDRSRPTQIASPVILDVGCGEGYYLAHLAAGFSAGELVTCRYVGLDSSKEAIRMAVRRLPALCGVVADVWQAIPVRTAACHVLLNIFAPRNIDEFARVLQSGGLLLVVIPAPEHLDSLRTLVPLIGVEEQKASHLLTDLARHSFRHTATHALTFTIHLNGNEAADLVAMSPSFRHLEPTDLDRVRAAGSVLTEARVLILAFQRMGTG